MRLFFAQSVSYTKKRVIINSKIAQPYFIISFKNETTASKQASFPLFSDHKAYGSKILDCNSEYLTAAINNNTFYVQAELNGLITLCGFIPNKCQDNYCESLEKNSFAQNN